MWYLLWKTPKICVKLFIFRKAIGLLKGLDMCHGHIQNVNTESIFKEREISVQQNVFTHTFFQNSWKIPVKGFIFIKVESLQLTSCLIKWVPPGIYFKISEHQRKTLFWRTAFGGSYLTEHFSVDAFREERTTS